MGDKDSGEPGHSGSGRERVPRNLFFSWAGQFVYIFAGFFLPRFLNGHLGQEVLGVWDLGWSIVSYFGLAQLGVNAAIDPYVARYRGAKDPAGLNRAMSSALCIQAVVAVVVLLLSVLAAVLVPALLHGRSEELINTARWVVALLGSSIGLQIAFNTFGGVICGCHRWDLHNAIDSGSYAAIVVGMALSLSAGGSLRGMATVYVTGTLIAELIRATVAHGVCPELRIRWQSVSWAEAKGMMTFGGKVFVSAMAGRLLYQTTSVLIASYLGPAALAMYSRPMALVQQLSTFVSKLGSMMTPIASQMDAGGHRQDLKDLALDATRYSALIALPVVVFLVILGGPLLFFWMGPAFNTPIVVGILALGHLSAIAHRPLMGVLTGIGRHGRPALISLAAALACVGLGFLSLGVLQLGLPGAALSVVVPLSIAHGLVIPSYACRELAIPIGGFMRRTWLMPVVCTIPSAVWALAACYFLPPVPALAIGLGGGGPLVAFCYWRWALSSAERERVRRIVGRLVVRPAGAPVSEQLVKDGSRP